MTQHQEKLIDKVRKLIAKAESTDSQAEADALMMRANQILLEHNLSMSSVEMDEEENRITEESHATRFGENKHEGNQWEFLLMSTLCCHNMCGCILHVQKGVPGGTISIIGKPGNAETVLYLFDVARETIRRLSKQAYSSYRKGIMEEYDDHEEQALLKSEILAYRMPWIRNYLKGAALGLNAKLESQKEKIVEESGVADQFALMVLDNDKAIDAFKDKFYGDKLTDKKKATVANQEAFELGMRDGENISLAKGIAGAEAIIPKQLS